MLNKYIDTDWTERENTIPPLPTVGAMIRAIQNHNPSTPLSGVSISIFRPSPS